MWWKYVMKQLPESVKHLEELALQFNFNLITAKTVYAPEAA
jgi:hypothetical protein